METAKFGEKKVQVVFFCHFQLMHSREETKDLTVNFLSQMAKQLVLLPLIFFFFLEAFWWLTNNFNETRLCVTQFLRSKPGDGNGPNSQFNFFLFATFQKVIPNLFHNQFFTWLWSFLQRKHSLWALAAAQKLSLQPISI